MIWPLLTMTWTEPNFCWRWHVSRSSLETNSLGCIFAVPTDYWGRNLCCRDIWTMINCTTLRGEQTSLVGKWALPGKCQKCCQPIPTAVQILTDKMEFKELFCAINWNIQLSSDVVICRLWKCLISARYQISSGRKKNLIQISQCDASNFVDQSLKVLVMSPTPPLPNATLTNI